MLNTDLQNAEINLGSTLKDLLTVVQGEWCDTEKNGWNLVKLGNKFGFATMIVKSGESYMLPVETTKPITAVLYIGANEIKSGLIRLKQEAITSPLDGIAVILLK